MRRSFTTGIILLSLFGAAQFSIAEEEAAVLSDTSTLDFANGLYARKMYGPALEEYRKYIQSESSDASSELASAKFRYADCYYFLKNYDAALKYFKMFTEEYPNDPRLPMALFRAGCARYLSGNTLYAIRTFLGVLEVAEDPNIRSGALFYLGKCYDKREKPEKAISCYERITHEYPQTEYAAYAGILIGDYYVKKSAWDQALKGYGAAQLQNSPVEVQGEATFKIADIYFARKDYPAARSAYEKIYNGVNESLRGDAKNERLETVRDRALLGLFYCDASLQDLNSAQDRFSKNSSLLKEGASKAEASLILAGLLAEHKDYDLALTLLTEAASNRGLRGDLYEKIMFKKSSVLSSKKDYEAAIGTLDELLKKNPSQKDRAIYEEATLYQLLGKDDKALEQYLEVSQKYEKGSYGKNALYEAALTFRRLKRLAEARQTFELYSTKYAPSPEAEQAELEILQMTLEDKAYTEAESLARQFLERHPRSLRVDIATYKLALSYMGQKKYQSAGEAFNKIITDYPDSKLYPESLYGLGASLESDHHIDKAVVVYERLLSELPDHALSQSLLSRLGYLYIALGDYPKMSAYYQEVLFKRPNVKLDIDGVFWLVRYLVDEKQYLLLQRVLDVLPKRFPDRDLSHEVAFFNGESLMGLGDYTKASDAYAKALAAKADGTFASYATLGQGLCQEALGNLPEAEKKFTAALRFDQETPVTLRARFEIANLRLRDKNLLAAAKAFMLVAILYDDPKYVPMALYKAAECFGNLGQPDEAAKALMELKTRFPGSEWAKKAPPYEYAKTHTL